VCLVNIAYIVVKIKVGVDDYLEINIGVKRQLLFPPNDNYFFRIQPKKISPPPLTYVF